jgi:hypothetical protein
VLVNVASGRDEPGARPVALFILGLGRSGTSALARALSLCGGGLPAALLGATSSNPRGNWEPRAAIHLNEAILHRHGTSAYDPTLRFMDEGTNDAEERAAHVSKIKVFLSTLPDCPFVVIKEGRITLLSDLWFEAAHSVGLNVGVVIALRHPQEVIASTAAHIKASPELTSALWLKYTLLAERNTRDVPRVFVDYANLLEDWRREMSRISSQLRVDFSKRDDGAIDEFLSRDLHHQRHHGPVPEAFGTDWSSVVYEALSAAARDEHWDGSALDHVLEAFRASERGFRTAFDDFRGQFSGVLFRPPVMKLILGGFAMANRRSGTWA